MKVIIAGSRTIRDYGLATELIERTPFQISEVVSGCAKGVDLLGIRWAHSREIPVLRHPAEWDKHGLQAGLIRNREMAQEAEGLIIIWDGKSRGSWHMLNTAKSRKLYFVNYVIQSVDYIQDEGNPSLQHRLYKIHRECNLDRETEALYNTFVIGELQIQVPRPSPTFL